MLSTQRSEGTDQDRTDSELNPVSRVLVISGGSGYNDLVGATPGATFVMPISDNGGSSSEIIRVLGGPSIGDLRSRLNRLIPTPTRPSNDVAAYAIPSSNEALYNLLSYRLPSQGKTQEIKQEWMDILEGRHALWRGIEPERKEVIRGFLVHFESEILRRAHRHFNFRGGSIGNFFLAAAQKFFRSIQSAIFLFSATALINSSRIGSQVLPVINTNHTATIAAELEDGDMIVGQCEISHPAPKSTGSLPTNEAALTAPASCSPEPPSSCQTYNTSTQDSALLTPSFGFPAHYSGQGLGTSFESAVISGYPSQTQFPSHASPSESQLWRQKVTAGPSPLFARLVDEKAAIVAAARRGLTTVGNNKDGLDPDDDEGFDDEANDASATATGHQDLQEAKERTGNIVFQKDGLEQDSEACMPSKIVKLCYVNAYRNEIHPAPNPAFVSSILSSSTLIYSCGSLWTSIIPCLCLRGIATSIAKSNTLRHKILLLNTVHDRETMGLSALDFVEAIRSSLNANDLPGIEHAAEYPAASFITHLVYFPDGQIKVEQSDFEAMGICCVAATSALRTKAGWPKFDEEAVRRALEEITLQAA